MYDAEEPIEINLNRVYPYDAAYAAFSADLKAQVQIWILTNYCNAVDNPE